MKNKQLTEKLMTEIDERKLFSKTKPKDSALSQNNKKKNRRFVIMTIRLKKKIF